MMRISATTLMAFLAAACLSSGCAQNDVKRGLPDVLPHKAYNLPPAQQLLEPGPGVGGPGPGVLAVRPASAQMAVSMGASQFAFSEPVGMTVRWSVSMEGAFDSEPLVVPGRQDFSQGAIYRLKLTNVPGRAGVELYPTLEVGPTTPRTDAYLAHNAVPLQLTDEDIEQVMSGNFVTKVIYLPDPEHQALALAGVETLVSTRLDPGVDPIVEADRRGAILAILRIGNKDFQVPGGGSGGSVMPVSHSNAMAGVSGAPRGAPTMSFQPTGGPPHYVSGLTGPQYGMPITGTPIGLPGPPHIPLGVPAGLRKHVISNRTHMDIPTPPRDFRISVNQKPGMNYPRPVTRVNIEERVMPPNWHNQQPHSNRHQLIQHPPGCSCQQCQ